MDKKLELEWILHQLQIIHLDNKDVYLLEHVIRYKDYCAKDVMEWGREEGLGGLWNKIDDVLHVKLLEAVADGVVDKGIALKRLGAKYEYSESNKVDITSKGEKLESVVFYIPGNGRDE